MKRGSLFVWFVAGACLIAAEMGCYLSTRNWDPTALLQVGAASPARPMLERELGPLALATTQGHDGKYCYLVARRPQFWQLDPELLDAVQDPPYRYGRPLYPLLAGLGGALSPRATLAGMIVVQLLSGGLLAAAAASLARRSGMPTIAVLLGLANPGVYFTAICLTSDLLALALILAGLSCWQVGRARWSLALFAAAALAKEYYALTPLALAGSLLFQRRWRVAFAVGAIPLIPLFAWRLAIFVRLGVGEGAGNFTWPGNGVLTAAPGWDHSLALGALAIALVASSALAAVRTSSSLLRWQCAAWGLLGATASGLVWADPSDLLRVVAPLWWFATASLVSRRGASVPPAMRSVESSKSSV